MHVPVPEVGELRPVLVLAGDQPHLDLVDDAVRAPPLQVRLRLLGLVRPDEVLGERLVDHVETYLDRCWVVGGAVLAEQILQHIDGDVGPDLDPPHEVLADHPPREGLIGLGVQGVKRHEPSSTLTSAATGAGLDLASCRSVRTSITRNSTLSPLATSPITWKDTSASSSGVSRTTPWATSAPPAATSLATSVPSETRTAVTLASSGSAAKSPDLSTSLAVKTPDVIFPEMEASTVSGSAPGLGSI